MKYLLFFCLFFTLPAEDLSALRSWIGRPQLLPSTEEKPARTAVLIIAPPQVNTSYTDCRWQLGKKVWEQYMNSIPDVDCYFLQSRYPREQDLEQVWIEGNTIYIGDEWYKQYGNDRILHKTIVAIEKLLPDYTHFVRTNLNSFVNLKALRQYTRTHHRSMYTAFLWENQWYTLGYGILFTADVAAHLVSEYRRLEGLAIVSCYRADDCTLTSLAVGLDPEDPVGYRFRCCPTLTSGIRQLMCKESLSATRLSPYGVMLRPPISLESAKEYCDQAADTVMLYRIREGFDLEELAALYTHLLHKIYPELSGDNLVEYAGSLPTRSPD